MLLMKIAEYRFFKEAKGITNNSNHVKKDYVFCAYPGKKFDGAEFIKDAIEKGGKFEMGGKVDANSNFIEPAIISNLDSDALLMKEEM